LEDILRKITESYPKKAISLCTKGNEIVLPPRINVNRASRTELEQISGIGPATSQAIVDARPFKKMDDLVKVVAKVLGASKAAGLELEGKVILS
jgi:DNA uptake protein ComE-like DNA-binding protein